jgi:hypothetical protein
MGDDRDDDVRMLFRRLDDGPPLGIDVQDVMAGGRRVRARRTGLAVAGSMLAVAAAVAISLSLAGGARGPDPLPPADQPTTATTPETPVTTPRPTGAVSSGSPPSTSPPTNHSSPQQGDGGGLPPATTR